MPQDRNKDPKNMRGFDPNTIYSLFDSFNNLSNAFKQLNLPNMTKFLYFNPPNPAHKPKGGKKYFKPAKPTKPAKPGKPQKPLNFNGFLKAFSDGLNALNFSNPFRLKRQPGSFPRSSRRIIVKRTFLSNQLIVVKPPGYTEKDTPEEIITEETITEE
ncbi:MAG: hypothetical protein ACOWWO_13570 [Peptococcaceae bacterium]